MKPSDHPLEQSQIPLNPLGQSADLTKPSLKKGMIKSFPRHIARPQVTLSRTSREQESKLKPYSEIESLNLCPTLNFYQTETGSEQAIAQLHLDNIRQNLVKRIEAAKLAGNQELLATLEQELRSLTS